MSTLSRSYYCCIIILVVFFCVCSPKLSTEPLLNQTLNNEFLPRVVNGWPAKLGDVPYQVAFKKSQSRYSQLYQTFCGGTIIAPTKLLSAAHCFAKKKNMCEKLFSIGSVKHQSLSRTMAVAGNLRNQAAYKRFDSPEDGQWRKLKNVTFPYNYKFPKHDIAITFTRTPFVYNDYIGSIPYAIRFADYQGTCLVSGYGRISEDMKSDRLLLAHLTLVPWHMCNLEHHRNMRNFVCTSDRLSDVGKGDSGGPLVCANTGDPNELPGRGVLVGIVSGHRYGAGSFFTRVSDYRHYIETNRADLPLKLSFWIYLIYLILNELFLL